MQVESLYSSSVKIKYYSMYSGIQNLSKYWFRKYIVTTYIPVKKVRTKQDIHVIFCLGYNNGYLYEFTVQILEMFIE